MAFSQPTLRSIKDATDYFGRIGITITPEEKKPMIGTFFNLPPADYDRLKATAKEVGVTVSHLCRETVTRFLSNLEAECRDEH